MYESLMRHLHEDMRLIAFDTPGFGASDPFPGQPSIEQFADVLQQATRNLGHEHVHLIGHHTGAAIATQWAADDPDGVRSLTMIGALAMGAEERARWHAAIADTPIESDGSHFQAAWERVAAIDAQPVVFPPDPAVQHREAVDVLLATPRWHEAYLAVFSHNYEEVYARVRCPIHLLCGDEDILWPYLEATTRIHPEAQVTTVHGGAYVLDQHFDDVAPPIKHFLTTINLQERK